LQTRALPRNISTTSFFSPDSLRSGLLLLALALLLSLLVHGINQAFGAAQPEKAVMVVGIAFGSFLLLSLVVYLAKNRHEARPATAGLIALGSVLILAIAANAYVISFYVKYPGDYIIWSESEFVNDILKFRVGYPLFTDPANNECFTYPPGAQLSTYFFAWLSGNPTSIPAYRTVQVLYTLLAALLAMVGVRQLLRLTSEGNAVEKRSLAALGLPFLVLVATNSITNPFVYLLHNDALAQLGTIVAYLLLLMYANSRSRLVLVAMAVLPAIGFYVKQPLVAWAVFYALYLLIFDRPRCYRRVLFLTLVATFSLIAILGLSYLLWGKYFFYWVFYVVAAHGSSPLRSFRHLLDIWPYVLISLISVLVLLRHKRLSSPQFGLWLIGFLVLLQEVYTSGIVWMTNHIGPGTLIAGIWFWAAMVTLYDRLSDWRTAKIKSTHWVEAGAAVCCFVLLFNGLGFVAIPLKPMGKDAIDYAKRIEAEFRGMPADKVLLDMGTWVYMNSGVVMKDRASNIGETGFSQTGDFSGFLSRLDRKAYDRILVRNLHTDDFWYDHAVWSQSTGIRQSIMKNYHEVRRIPAISTNYRFGFSDISVLEPKRDDVASDTVLPGSENRSASYY